MIGLLFAAIMGAGSASADVLEWGAGGAQLTVQGMSNAAHTGAASTPPAARAARNVTPQDRVLYRMMAEDVALQFAGSDGVRLAGLDATSFMELFCALIYQESRFDPRAVSSKGAIGVGQLMPATAALLAVDDPYEPEANLRGAAQYFTEQLELFGDVTLALAAYNAGPHRVEKYGGVPPFRETRDYIARITEAAGLTETPAAASSPPRAFTAHLPSPPERKVSVWEY